MPSSCYIHIPFCSGTKCKYCSFVSFNKPELIAGYMYSLLKEINENYNNESLKTLYIGGGTPSLVSIELLSKLIKKFKFTKDSEITIELNPENGNLQYLESLRKIGFNRLSIGSQTFNDELLQLTGRRHSSNDIINTIKNAKSAGFDNISIDLIYGLPTQTISNIENDLDKFLELDIRHISTYGLKIEDKSYWGENIPENLPDDDVQADMYEKINKILANNDFYRYEVSNFSKTGFESKHNLNYWNNEEYYGFGVSAHGYVNGIRYYNYSTLDKYMDNPSLHEYGKFLTQQEKLEEEIFLGFRKSEGINTQKINELYNIDFDEKYKKVIQKYAEYIDKTPTGYALNLKGTMLSNIILAEFL